MNGFFTGDERLEVDVQNLTLDRVTLDLANERLRRMAANRNFDDRALSLNVGEELVEIARIERERLRIASVSVDHGGNLSLPAKGPGGALSTDVASRCVK